MAAEKETVEPVAQEQTIHVHDASGDEHIQPKPIAIRFTAKEKDLRFSQLAIIL
jgi:hypothetical protein